MGILLPTPEYDPGSDCPHCTPPVGELWDPENTPECVYVTMNHLNACAHSPVSMPNGRVFKLTQDPGLPCRYDYEGPVWKLFFIAYDALADRSALRCDHVDGHFLFMGDLPGCPFEFQGFDNIIVTCPNQTYGKDGIGVVSWNEIAIDVAGSFPLEFGPRLMHEFFTHEDGSIVLKYCDKRDATNVKVKISFD